VTIWRNYGPGVIFVGRGGTWVGNLTNGALTSYCLAFGAEVDEPRHDDLAIE
jgi:hypothetical protein